MPAWTLADAQRHLDLWLEADAAVATGQSYKIGTRSLTRANVDEIENRIKFWRKEVSRLEAGRSPGARVFRGVPRDL